MDSRFIRANSLSLFIDKDFFLCLFLSGFDMKGGKTMTSEQLYDVWWTEDNGGEQRMEEEHLRHWEKVLQMVEEQELSDLNILDFGCNQGGFLRYLYKERPFKEGVGVDLAQESIQIANKRKGAAPLTYVATSTPEQFANHFDLASAFLLFI